LAKYVCYTLDLEEDHAGYLKNSYEGLTHLEEFIQIIKEKKIPVSFFIQAKLIEKFPEKIEAIRQNEFDTHLHSYSHSIKNIGNIIMEQKEIEKSKRIYKEFFGKDPIGYRFPLGIINKDMYKVLEDMDFKFDSSIFPTIRPKYFNNLDAPLTPFFVGNVMELPFSVISRALRIPVALSYIKLFYPLHFIKSYRFSPIIFDFHMHDLYDLNSTKKLGALKRVPYMVKRKFGLKLFLKFHDKLENEGYKAIEISKVYGILRKEV